MTKEIFIYLFNKKKYGISIIVDLASHNLESYLRGYQNLLSLLLRFRFQNQYYSVLKLLGEYLVCYLVHVDNILFKQIN